MSHAVMITTPARTAMEGHGLTDARTILASDAELHPGRQGESVTPRAVAYAVYCPATERYSLVTLDGRWIIPGSEGYKTRGPVSTYARKNITTVRPGGLVILEPVRHNGPFEATQFGRRRGTCRQAVRASTGMVYGFKCSCGAPVSPDRVHRDGWEIVRDGRGTHTVSYALRSEHRREYGTVPTEVPERANVVVAGAPETQGDALSATAAPATGGARELESVAGFVWERAGRGTYGRERYTVITDGRWRFQVDVSAKGRDGMENHSAPLQMWFSPVDKQWHPGAQVAQFAAYSREASESDIRTFVDGIKAREARHAELLTAGEVPALSEYRKVCGDCRVKGKESCTCGMAVIAHAQDRGEAERLFKACRDGRPFYGKSPRKEFAPVVKDGEYAPGMMIRWEIEGITYTGQVWATDVASGAWNGDTGTATAVIVATVDGRAATRDESCTPVPLYTGKRHGKHYAHVSAPVTPDEEGKRHARVRADVEVIEWVAASDGLFEVEETQEPADSSAATADTQGAVAVVADPYARFRPADAAPVSAEEVGAYVTGAGSGMGPCEVPAILRDAVKASAAARRGITLYPSQFVGREFVGIDCLLTWSESDAAGDALVSVMAPEYLDDMITYLDDLAGFAVERGESTRDAREFARWVVRSEMLLFGQYEHAYDAWRLSLSCTMTASVAVIVCTRGNGASLRMRCACGQDHADHETFRESGPLWDYSQGEDGRHYRHVGQVDLDQVAAVIARRGYRVAGDWSTPSATDAVRSARVEPATAPEAEAAPETPATQAGGSVTSVESTDVSAPAPAGVSDPGGVGVWESDGGACADVRRPGSPDAGRGTAPVGADPSPKMGTCTVQGVDVAPMRPDAGTQGEVGTPTTSAADAGEGQSVAAPAEAEITIRHTRADGTLVEGSRKGDGVYELLRPHGFRYFPSLRQLGIRQSRDRAAQSWKINAGAAALRGAGFTVAVEINEEERRSFAEAEAERVERAEERAERFDGYAANAGARSDAAWKRGHEIADGIPMGQPILVGHHSESRARRDQERIHNATRTSIDEGKRAAYWAGRAKSAASYEAYRKNPGVTLRRIDKLQAQLRRVEKWQRGESAGGYTRALTPDTVAELARTHQDLTEELSFWRDVIAQAEAAGFKVWGKSDFVKGDFVRHRGTWYEVVRVSAKSVSVPHIHAYHQGGGAGAVGGRPVVTKESAAQTPMGKYTWTAPYDDVQGRMPAEEMRARLAGTWVEPEPQETATQQKPAAAPGRSGEDAAPTDNDRAAVPPYAADAVSDPSGVDVFDGEGGAPVEAPRTEEQALTARIMDEMRAAEVVPQLRWSQAMADVVAYAAAGELHADGVGGFRRGESIGSRRVDRERVRLLLGGGFLQAPTAARPGPVACTPDGHEALRLAHLNPAGLLADSEAMRAVRRAKRANQWMSQERQEANALPPLPDGDEIARRRTAAAERMTQYERHLSQLREETDAIVARAEAKNAEEQRQAEARRAAAAAPCEDCSGVYPVEARCGQCRDREAAGLPLVDIARAATDEQVTERRELPAAPVREAIEAGEREVIVTPYVPAPRVFEVAPVEPPEVREVRALVARLRAADDVETVEEDASRNWFEPAVEPVAVDDQEGQDAPVLSWDEIAKELQELRAELQGDDQNPTDGPSLTWDEVRHGLETLREELTPERPVAMPVQPVRIPRQLRREALTIAASAALVTVAAGQVAEMVPYRW
ncbi:DUF3560 domain-containing protein [Streptomyces chartreusis]